jgi:hypothetical protein
MYWYVKAKRSVTSNDNILRAMSYDNLSNGSELIRERAWTWRYNKSLFSLYTESKLNDTFEPKVVLKMLCFLQMEEESNNCILECDAIYSSNYCIYLIISWSLLKKISLSENATWLKIVSLTGGQYSRYCQLLCDYSIFYHDRTAHTFYKSYEYDFVEFLCFCSTLPTAGICR